MRGLLRFLFWTALVLGLVIGLARLVFLRWWRVPDDDPWLEASVAPTLAGGDLVLLWRFTKPAYGDLVVCPEPDAPERWVVGRIVAEAGDKITVSPGNLKINDKVIDTERGCDRFVVKDPNDGSEVEQRCSEEDLSGVLHKMGSATGHKVREKPFEAEVEEGNVFLLSDNRLYPYDSRDFGPVPRETCKETVFFRLVSGAGYSDVKGRFTFIR